MKILFFDMEFANGKVPGSVYSLGYVMTNEKFELTEPQTDLLINPDCEWNNYVKTHILAYPFNTVMSASLFPAYYRRIKKLMCKADLVVGFAVKNDTTALKKACERYGLKPLSFACLDMERLCVRFKDHPEAHGLDGWVRAYCNVVPENRHRSDGDAYATMLLLKELCRLHQISPKDLKKLYPDQFVQSLQVRQSVKSKGKRARQAENDQAVQDLPKKGQRKAKEQA